MSLLFSLALIDELWQFLERFHFYPYFRYACLFPAKTVWKDARTFSEMINTHDVAHVFMLLSISWRVLAKRNLPCFEGPAHDGGLEEAESRSAHGTRRFKISAGPCPGTNESRSDPCTLFTASYHLPFKWSVCLRSVRPSCPHLSWS